LAVYAVCFSIPSYDLCFFHLYELNWWSLIKDWWWLVETGEQNCHGHVHRRMFHGNGIFYFQTCSNVPTRPETQIRIQSALLDLFWYVTSDILLCKWLHRWNHIVWHCHVCIMQSFVQWQCPAPRCISCPTNASTAILSLLVVSITLINSIVCYLNFGKGLKQHISGEQKENSTGPKMTLSDA
jgi:hypothetical protein